MHINNSRKSTHSIMKNPGFGELKVVHAGVCFVLPPTALTSIGSIKREAINAIKKCDTIADALLLSEQGFQITTS